jgi:8-oxo-dGTP diphosphatase
LIRNERGEIAIVRTPAGVFLPGGGIEAGESVATAVEREAREECGLVIRVRSWSTAAVQFAYSESEGQEFEKHCTFIEAITESATLARAETDHELAWIDPVIAMSVLSHESHRWAVAELMAHRKASFESD